MADNDVEHPRSRVTLKAPPTSRRRRRVRRITQGRTGSRARRIARRHIKRTSEQLRRRRRERRRVKSVTPHTRCDIEQMMNGGAANAPPFIVSAASPLVLHPTPTAFPPPDGL